MPWETMHLPEYVHALEERFINEGKFNVHQGDFNEGGVMCCSMLMNLWRKQKTFKEMECTNSNFPIPILSE